VRFAALRPLVEDCAAVLTLLARAGQEAPDDVQRAFDAGADHLRGSKVPRAELGPAPGVDQVTHALGRLRAASPAIKRMVMNGCAACVLADGRVLLPELELLRAVAASLECPLPPLAAG
jgi:hypothetical protein